MSKRPISPTSEIPAAHRHCQRVYRGSPVSYVSPCPDYIPTSPAYKLPPSPYTGPIGSPPRHCSSSATYDDCPSYSPNSPAGYLLLKFHPTFDRTDVMSPTYDVDGDPLRFAPIKPSKVTTWTWPNMPKATRPMPTIPEFDDDVECSEVADICDPN